MEGQPIDPRFGRMALQHLESLQRFGMRQLPRLTLGSTITNAARPARGETSPLAAASSTPPAQNEAVAAPSRRSAQPASNSPAAPLASTEPPERSATAGSTDRKRAELAALRDEASQCARCPVLVANRSQVVLGVGNPDAQLTFFGEAPGADEDRLGEPFVGAAGKLLDKIIENACGMRREDVFICNTVCCRPPGNRNPEPEEISNCRRFSERQLEIVHSPFICCLGAVAAQTLLQTNLPVGKLRGTVHTYKWAKVVVTYHPAYLLRSPNQKRATWEDIKILLREMGKEGSADGGGKFGS